MDKQHSPYGFTQVKPIMSDEQLKQFVKSINSPEYQNYSANHIKQQIMDSIKIDLAKIPSPEEQLKFLTDRIDSMQSELITQTNALQSVHYENMKLNAQIEVLNKTIESNEEKLDELRTTNSELKLINSTLKESNKHYWRNTFIIAFIVAIISFLLGLFATEVKTLLQSIPNI